MMSLSGKAYSSIYHSPFELFKYVSSKKDLFELEIQTIDSTIVDYDQDIVRIVLKENQDL